MRSGVATAVLWWLHFAFTFSHELHHQHLHKRSVVTSHATVTDIITVTDYDAVIWVDHAGNVIKTERKNIVSATEISSSIETSHSSVPPTASVTTKTMSDPATSGSESEQSHQTVSARSSTLDSTPSVNSHPVSSTSSASDQSPGKHDNTNSGGNIAGFGVAYDAWAGSSCRPSLDAEFGVLAGKGASIVRVYDVCFVEAIKAAAAHNLKLMIGLTSFNDFENKLNKLAKDVVSTPPSWSVVDTVFVGNELVNKGLASSADVAGKVSYARGILKAKGFSGNVVTVDTWIAMRNDASICSTSDYCAVNAHAFFDGNVAPSNAGQFVRMAQGAVGTKNPGKRIVITESGWPHAGASLGAAIANVDSQRIAMASIVKEFSGDAANLFLFMAYDATYKTGEAEIERNFGIFDTGIL